MWSLYTNHRKHRSTTQITNVELAFGGIPWAGQPVILWHQTDDTQWKTWWSKCPRHGFLLWLTRIRQYMEQGKPSNALRSVRYTGCWQYVDIVASVWCHSSVDFEVWSACTEWLERLSWCTLYPGYTLHLLIQDLSSGIELSSPILLCSLYYWGLFICIVLAGCLPHCFGCGTANLSTSDPSNFSDWHFLLLFSYICQIFFQIFFNLSFHWIFLNLSVFLFVCWSVRLTSFCSCPNTLL